MANFGKKHATDNWRTILKTVRVVTYSLPKFDEFPSSIYAVCCFFC